MDGYSEFLFYKATTIRRREKGTIFIQNFKAWMQMNSAARHT
jgi:hypothetical protein